MIQLSRRELLSGTAATSTALSLGIPATARAAAPAVGKQNAGFYRYKVGDIEVTVVTDGSNTFKFADNHVANKTRDDLNKALEAAHQPKDLMTTPYNPIVVNTAGRSEEHTSELQSQLNLVCRLLLEKKKLILRFSFILAEEGGILNDFERAIVGTLAIIPSNDHAKMQPILRAAAARCVGEAISRRDL